MCNYQITKNVTAPMNALSLQVRAITYLTNAGVFETPLTLKHKDAAMIALSSTFGFEVLDVITCDKV